mmetsp:Transcript_24133/g.66879  ORF Transcript_24133/g.66879 Transcript_24133/m.66879 type:complete len:91 (-) Transcript_24133:20-292(-)
MTTELSHHETRHILGTDGNALLASGHRGEIQPMHQRELPLQQETQRVSSDALRSSNNTCKRVVDHPAVPATENDDWEQKATHSMLSSTHS